MCNVLNKFTKKLPIIDVFMGVIFLVNQYIYTITRHGYSPVNYHFTNCNYNEYPQFAYPMKFSTCSSQVLN